MSAAVQENSGAPWPPPVSGEKYSAKPCSSTSARVRRRSSSASSARALVPQALDDRPVRVHPGGALPVAVLLEVARTDGHAGHRVRGPVRSGSRSSCDQLADVSGAGEEREEGRDGGLQQRLVGHGVTRSSTGRVGPCHRSSIAAACASMCRLELAEVRAERSERVVGGGEERVEPDVLDEHRPGRAACAGGRSRSAGRAPRARACAGRRRRTPARSRGGSGCRSGASAAGAPGAGARRRAATTASATPRSACIHGGVESRPHSHGWMRVTSGEPSSRRSRSSHAW